MRLPAEESRPKSKLWAVAAIAVVLLSIAAIVTTYPTFNATYDEPFHLACGLEPLERGTYTIERQHPPLARIAIAIGPYLAGIRTHPHTEATDEGNEAFYAGGRYPRNVTLARLGTLPFFILACAVVFAWGWRWFSPSTGFIALTLFLSLPPVLGHAGLATLDMACAATIALALYAWLRWLEEPAWKTTLYQSAAIALALLCKLSSPGYLGLCFAVSGVYFYRRNQSFDWRARRSQLLATVAMVTVIVWAGYGFSVKPLADFPNTVPTLASATSMAAKARILILTTPLPLTGFVHGLVDLYNHNKEGHESYLLGDVRTHGWWYFFPVVLAVKTPIGFLALAIAGVVFLWRNPGSRTWQQSVVGLFPVPILLAAMTSNINLGVRHILAIYPVLAITAGYIVDAALRSGRGRSKLVAGALLAFSLSDSVIAHPDYLAYFNQLASSHPERVLCESDLDWGQDFNRLALRLKSLNIHEVGIAYFGKVWLDQAGLPPYHVLSPTETPHGYAAISAHFLFMENAKDGSYSAFKGAAAIEKVGKSIYLFHFE